MAITRVQGNARGSAGSGTTIDVTLASTPVNGNILIACIGYYAATTQGIVSSIAQAGVTWALQKRQQNDPAYGSDVEIWYGVVGAGASTSITITVSQTIGMAVADVCEYSGLLTTGFLDKTAGAITYSSTTAHSGTTDTTTQAVELWIGALHCPSGYVATQTNPTDGFTLLDGASEQFGSIYISLGYAEKIVSATGTAHVDTTTAGGSTNNVGCIATFKAIVGKGKTGNIVVLMRGMDLLQISKRFPKLKPRLVI